MTASKGEVVSPLNILIVEDDEMQGELLKEVLEEDLPENGITPGAITVKRSKSEALSYIADATTRPDVAIVDLGLKSLDTPDDIDEYQEGMEIVKKLYELKIKYLVTTAIQVAGFQRLAAEHGIPYKNIPAFSKPFMISDVIGEFVRMAKRMSIGRKR